MKAVEIKGKSYVEVSERIKHFREKYPEEESITTEILSNENGMCVIKATITVDGKIVATGHAYEKEGSSFINKTSYIENCETSAVGRALGILGIGIDGGIASAEEVAKATQFITDEQIAELDGLIKATNTDVAKFLSYMGVGTYNEIVVGDYKKAKNALEAKKRGEQ